MIAKIKYHNGVTSITGVFSTLAGLKKWGLGGIKGATIEIYDDNTMTSKPVKTIDK